MRPEIRCTVRSVYRLTHEKLGNRLCVPHAEMSVCTAYVRFRPKAEIGECASPKAGIQIPLAYRRLCKKVDSLIPKQRISAAGGIASPYGCAIPDHRCNSDALCRRKLQPLISRRSCQRDRTR